jgi:hypothetical protein
MRPHGSGSVRLWGQEPQGNYRSGNHAAGAEEIQAAKLSDLNIAGLGVVTRKQVSPQRRSLWHRKPIGFCAVLNAVTHLKLSYRGILFAIFLTDG